MAKRVVVIASGETERLALPHLLRHLGEEGTLIDEPIRTPSRNRAITAENACRLVLSAWYEKLPTGRPDKFVILLDADAKDPQDIVARFEEDLKATAVGHRVPVPILSVAAKWHLEAWFFACAASLRDYLGRDLGNVDTSQPDEIVNPKRHLIHLLKAGRGEIYTARVSAEIAQRLSAQELRRSASFARFESAVRNGPKPA
ncbi:hypothetical protein BE21_04520 [Sorangium cellulosum]|uniref:DUF4276 family protein n=1 Tax=Sorangium cellulosum TaxID=56 RepID=A0A150TGP1_SORCE|nr:hypothetical protein BE21_04520 [Sorangium cellulosum]